MEPLGFGESSIWWMRRKSPAEMAFPVIRPPAFQRVVPPIGTERRLFVDEVEHDRFEPIHIVPAGTRMPSTVLEKRPRKVN